MGYMRIYGLDVKDRLRTLNHPKFLAAHMRPPSAREYGADVTIAYASVSLASQQ